MKVLGHFCTLFAAALFMYIFLRFLGLAKSRPDHSVGNFVIELSNHGKVFFVSQGDMVLLGVVFLLSVLSFFLGYLILRKFGD